MEIGKRMKSRRKELKLTADQIAEAIGVSRSNVYRYENGDIENLPLEILKPLSSILKTTPQYLMGWDDNISVDITTIYNQLEPPRQEKVYNYANNQLIEQNQVQEATTVYVTSKLSAGPGVIDLDPRNVEEVQYDGYVPRHDLAFQVAGDSMEPLFEDGEIVFVERTEDIYSGQVIAVQINEESFIKKAYIENDQLRLVSLNSMYDDILADGTDNIRVVGRVIL